LKIQSLILVIIAVFLTFPSCVTKKKRGDVSALKKFYHNTTAEFNGYYNANVILNESILQLNEQHEDNYNQVLDIYEYVEAPNPTALAGELDNAIKKVAMVVALHRVSHWTDDCYLLMGQAQYLKQDYESAEETFKYLVTEFEEDGTEDSPNVKKKKTRSEKQKSAKEKRKEREKERKQKQKEIKKRNKERRKAIKRRRKGKAPKGKDPVEALEEKQEAEKQEAEMAEIAEEPESNTNPDNYFLKHRPAYQGGQLWLARTLVERGKFEAADRIFRKMAEDPKTFKDIQVELAPAMAYSALEQQRYNLAITHLQNAILLEKDKTLKARYAFIVAQLLRKVGNTAEAYAYFEKVLDFRPSYEMEFNTKLQLATNAYATGKSSPAEIKRDLEKMLKDEKNLEYRDQIYFALAQVAFQNEERKEGIRYLSLSAKYTAGNKAQQAEAYYQLASLFLENEEYPDAKLYFDSTLTVMAENDERYPEVQLFSKNLAEIATNIQVITLQDSLLMISRMSADEKKALALELKRREEEERIKEAEALARQNAIAANNNNGPQNRDIGAVLKNNRASLTRGGSSGNFVIEDYWAYDDKLVRRGKREFDKKFGNRPLVDNWRISSKIESALEEVEEEEQADRITLSTDISQDEIDNILADVPSNPVEIAKANKVVENALFALGKLYRDKIQNYNRSIESLEELLRRYPETQNKAEAWYYLYLDNTDIGNSAKAEEYRQKLLNDAKDSIYAQVLANPNYFNESESEEKRLNKYYNDAYAMFTSGNYREAYSRADNSSKEFGNDNPLRAKFAMLRAMSSGNLEGEEQYVNSLKDLIAKYPDTEEERRAREILRLLGDDSQYSSIKDGENNDNTKSSNFAPAPDDLHYIIIVLDKNASLNKAKTDIGKLPS
jgi:tetratricopeptide (TPR) repeat protein